MAEKRIMIVAGEASADRYAARLVTKLRDLHGSESVEFYGTGGDEMQKAGVHLFCHLRALAHIGVREALTSLSTYFRVFRRLVRFSDEHRPDLVVLLDFPDFNLRLAKKMKRRGIKVIYYISPQIWAWRSGRIRAIRDYVDKMLVILPFEEEYYRSRGVDVEFVGHPLLEDFNPDRDRAKILSRLGLEPSRKTVALLAGSRQKEIDYILPTLLSAAMHLLKDIPVQFVISVAPSVDYDHVHKIAQSVLPAHTLANSFRLSSLDAADILASCDFALVKSGTSSLVAALVGVPFLITYKISPMSWFIGSMLIRSSMKGLVNLIANERIVPELFQKEATPQELARLALEYLSSSDKSSAMRSQLARTREKLSVRCASDTAAAIVSGYLRG